MFKNLFTGKVESVSTPIAMDLTGIDLAKLPQHIAIIMDGNGRWAKARGKARTYGHQAGAETLKAIVRAAASLGIRVLSAYAFSTENWKRPVSEVGFIMELLSHYLTSELNEFSENNVQLRFSGSRSGLPEAVQEKMEQALAATRKNNGIILNLAINYGGRAEIVHAVRGIAAEVAAGQLQVEQICDADLESHLYTAGLPAPDLLIRPGGEARVSNFLLWQIAYAEIWTTPLYWPDFTPQHLLEAIRAYQGRERRFGGLLKQ